MSNERRRRDDERREVRRVFIDAEEVIIRADRVRIVGDEDRRRDDDRRDDDRRCRRW
ncbi:hypothetical protein [Neobacillus niacini]|uniref:hypothetical protein n=1 Tax=Neobacillus niacini TaxID=86668 RepID=UPI000B32A474|nr:hypothetical protein [Neobacillus niacini]